MMNRVLNVVSLNVPFPANYGGVMDIFFRLKALSEAGVEIVLHTFKYGRDRAAVLEGFCREVYYYERKTGWRSQFSWLPYIVYSRRSEELVARLCENDAPVLFEGLHTCFCLNDGRLRGRRRLVRMHNVEHRYYGALAGNARSWWKKVYFGIEALRLRWFERQLRYADCIFAVSGTEYEYFRGKYEGKVVLLPPFHPNREVVVAEKFRRCVLYEGDLSSPENVRSVVFLLDRVAGRDAGIEWIVAGLNPDRRVVEAAAKWGNVQLRANLEEEEMVGLLREALITVLYTNQATGFKLKLLNAVYNCRYCLANAAMLSGSGLDDACVRIGDDAEDILETIRDYIRRDFPEVLIEKRKELLAGFAGNEANARKIVALL
jgi:hypothetical protein